MSEESKNFYTILGVDENASIDEIKKSYRKLSLKYHPDRNQGDIEKVKIFQKINEAYETLGDQERKSEYDMSRKNPFMRMNSMGGMNMGGGMHGSETMDINDLFANLFFGGGMPGMGGMGGMPGSMPGSMPGGLFHSGFPPGANIRVFRNGVPVNMGQSFEKPTPIIKTIHITMETVLHGGKLPLEIERWSMESGNKVFETVTLYIDIFKGIDHNEIIIIKDQGNSIHETCKGDIKVFVSINNESEFIRRGLDLFIQKEITLKEALCGFSFELKYINKKIYTIHNNAGNVIPPNYQKIIPDMGLTRDEHKGNLIIQFNIVFPETLSLEQIASLEKIL
uniref:J domain-containing protein n=1 Tax=viral metagenome TaxID=1070528 RepID=A0A6C0B1C8_9ZZZZ